MCQACWCSHRPLLHVRCADAWEPLCKLQPAWQQNSAGLSFLDGRCSSTLACIVEAHSPHLAHAGTVGIPGTYMPYCGLQREEDWPDSCNVNLYEDGSNSVGWHSDDEALFQGLIHDTRIISLSLGQQRKFDLRKNWPEDGLALLASWRLPLCARPQATRRAVLMLLSCLCASHAGEKIQERLHLGNGALATMEGMLQKHYMHRVPREADDLGPRINLTWRWIKKHSQDCPKATGP
eukprot:s5844_g8.t1